MFRKPSNKILILSITTLCVIALIITTNKLYGQSDSEETTTEDSQNVSVNISEIQKNRNDSDGDGLSDWEEELRGTKKGVADTDNDGTDDGTEVEEKRDPTVAGPDDELSKIRERESELLSQKSVYDGYKPGTLTDQVAISLFSNYASMKEQGNLGSESEDANMENLSQNARQQVDFIRPFSASELATLKIAQGDSIRDYGNKLGQIQRELLSRLASVDENDPSNPLGKAYRGQAEKLMAMRVPAGQKARHSEIANEYYVVAQVMENLVKNREDPLKALFSIEQYQKSQQRLTSLYTVLRTFFADNDIIFSDKEEGSILWQTSQE